MVHGVVMGLVHETVMSLVHEVVMGSVHKHFGWLHDSTECGRSEEKPPVYCLNAQRHHHALHDFHFVLLLAGRVPEDTADRPRRDP
jgi:hypothetical protein